MSQKHKKKIALVNNSFWYARRFRLGLMRYLRRMGFEVVVLGPEGEEKDMRALQREGFRVMVFRGSIYQTGIWNEWATLKDLIRIYRGERFDLALHYTIKPNIYGAFASLLSGVPCISITTGLGILKQHPFGFFSWLMRRLYQVAAWISREVWFLNEDDRRFFISKGMAPASRTFLLRSEGIDSDYYHPKIRPVSKGREAFRLLYLGRMLKSKGLEELREAARYFREKQLPVWIDLLGFHIEGHPDAVSRETVREWETSGNLRFLGATEDVRPFLANADAVVLPSYGEGISRTLLEACSMARPVVATDVEGCREIVRHGVNGFLCAPRDSASLIGAILHMYALPEAERAAMGKAGRRLIQEAFKEQYVLKQYEQRIGKYGRQKKTAPFQPVFPAYMPAAVNPAPA